ncbi:MAG: glycosyltransferase family 4 protein [Gemmatimonadota bacterium]
MAKLLFAANDKRSAWLAAAIRDLGHELVEVAFDDIDRATKLRAGVLSFSSPRMEWWQNYQTHPLVQARRAEVFRRNAQAHADGADGIVTWGSWFAPLLRRSDGSQVPYVYYIDQSRSVTPDPLELKPRFPRPRGGNRRQREGYLGSAGVFCMSRWAVDQTARAHPGLPPSLVQWAGWGPCAFDLSGEPLDERRGAPVVLHVGNDFYRKGVDFLVQVARRVRAEIPEARFIVVGKDQSDHPVDLSDVEYLGLLSDREQLKQLFRSASLFFLPNRFDRSPHVLVEAMSAGTPVVVSHQGGPGELVTTYDVGAGAAVGDISGYADAILALLRDDDRRRQYGLEGKRLAATTFSWREIAQRVTAPLLAAQGASPHMTLTHT